MPTHSDTAQGAIAFFQWLVDLLEVYKWREFWIIASVPSSIAGLWFLFGVLLGIQNDLLRAVAIWSLLLTLMLGGVTSETLRNRRG